MRQWRLLVCLVAWLLIALPYVPIMWCLTQPSSPWPKGVLRLAITAVLLTAVFGVSLFSLLQRSWAIAGGIFAGFSSWLILRLLSYWSIPLLPVTGYEILPWSVIAGVVSGGIWSRLVVLKTGFLLNKTNFLWTAVAAWIVILRLWQIFVAGVLANNDALFGEEVLVFFPVLLLSTIGANVLYGSMKSGSGHLIMRSLVSAFLIQELAGIAIFPLMIVARGQVGTRGAVGLLCLIPGPGILWGTLVGYLLTRSQRAHGFVPSGQDVDANLPNFR